MPAVAHLRNEANWTTQLIARLQHQHWQTRREVRIVGGRIDLIAERNGVQLLIEVKKSTKPKYVESAIRQLKAYRLLYPDAYACFASPETFAPGDATLGLLARLGISILSLPLPTSWEFVGGTQ